MTTLHALDARPGDVIRHRYGATYTITDIRPRWYADDPLGHEVPLHGDRADWEIISRGTGD